jgi:hypothetical protein
MKTECLFRKLAWAAPALVLLFAACANPASSDGPVDKTALIIKINEANAAKYNVIVAEDATKAPEKSKWATPAQMGALQEAIAEAENAILSDNDAVAAAVTKLNAAIAIFNAAVTVNGLGSQTSGYTPAQFNELRVIATAAKAGVVISVDGKDVPVTSMWVTQAAMTVFDAAIAAADTTVSDMAYQALLSALNTFNAAKNPGSKSGSGDDAFAGTWISEDNFIRLDASNGSFRGYLVSGGKEVVRGTYTVSGNAVASKITQINIAAPGDADAWVSWANFSDEQKAAIGGGETQQLTISGNAIVVNNNILIKQTGTGGGGNGAITFTGIASQYNGQYAIFYSSSSTPPAGGDVLIGGNSVSYSGVTGARISGGSVTIPVYLTSNVASSAPTSNPYSGSDKNIRIYLSIKDSPSFTIVDLQEGAYEQYTINSVSFTNGSASVNLGGSPSGSGNILVITNISDDQLSQGSNGAHVLIFQPGISPDQALSEIGLIIYLVAGASSDEGHIALPSGSPPYTVNVGLYNIPSVGGRWTGSGVYDIYIVLYDESYQPTFYRTQAVTFVSGTTTVSAESFSPLQIDWEL